MIFFFFWGGIKSSTEWKEWLKKIPFFFWKIGPNGTGKCGGSFNIISGAFGGTLKYSTSWTTWLHIGLLGLLGCGTILTSLPNSNLPESCWYKLSAWIRRTDQIYRARMRPLYVTHYIWHVTCGGGWTYSPNDILTKKDCSVSKSVTKVFLEQLRLHLVC